MRYLNVSITLIGSFLVLASPSPASPPPSPSPL